MGRSLTVSVFFGATLPCAEETGVRPQLTVEAIAAMPDAPSYVADDDMDPLYVLATYHPRFRDVLCRLPPSSGSYDYVTGHLAIAESELRSHDGGPIALAPEMMRSGPLTEDWAATIREALACLRWLHNDGECAAPSIPIRWWVAGCYW